MIGYGWGNVCYLVHFPLGEYLLYSNIPKGVCYVEGVLYDTGIYVNSGLGECLDKLNYDVNSNGKQHSLIEFHTLTSTILYGVNKLYMIFMKYKYTQPAIRGEGKFKFMLMNNI